MFVVVDGICYQLVDVDFNPYDGIMEYIRSKVVEFYHKQHEWIIAWLQRSDMDEQVNEVNDGKLPVKKLPNVCNRNWMLTRVNSCLIYVVCQCTIDETAI